MNFVFTRRFYLLLAIAIIPLSLAWTMPSLVYGVIAYDALIIAAAITDIFLSRKLPEGLSIYRQIDGRFAIGETKRVDLMVENASPRRVRLILKDEYPAEMALISPRSAEISLVAQGTADAYYELTPARRGKYEFGKIAVRHLSKLGLVWCQSFTGESQSVKVYPNMRRAREMELKALGARSFMAIQRKAVRRGEGREFESMRDYVRGDELRHISWTTTARRSKLTTRQYQIERDQTVVVLLDAGRLMTGRIGNETKFETALHASLALMSASARAGDNFGMIVFGRRIKRFLPPKRGVEHIDAVLEALYDVEPELIEPSYARSFQFVSSNIKKRAFVVVLTDLVDKHSSRELLTSLQLLRPRHLPLVATIGDRDLNAVVGGAPHDIRDVFIQSAAEEIIHHRESALKRVESAGGLALDVTAKTLAPRLLETYLRVKERGML